jgi:FkbM family methyltransferase
VKRPRGVKHAAGRLLQRLGYTVVPEWRLPRHEQARYLGRLLDWAGIDLVIDVGANAGQFRGFLRNEAGYGGHIVSFEPLNDLVAKMRQIEDAAWTIHACALGARPGRRSFNVMAADQYSSFLAPRGRLPPPVRHNIARRSVEVEVQTLDQFAATDRHIAHARSIYLKLDTQGTELDVLDGATQVLERTAALQVELALQPLYDGAPDYRAAMARIERAGFTPSAMFNNNPEHFPLLLELDGCFVARRLVEPSDSA